MTEGTMRRPYVALRHAEFRRIAGAMLVSLTGSQMQSVAIDWHVWVLTRSPLALGSLGLVRVLPIVVFSVWGGLVADRHDRRRVLLLTQSVSTVIALALAALTFAGREHVALIYLLTACGAGATAFDNPARQALLPRLVPVEDLPGALAIMLSIFQFASIGGPALAGLLIAGGALLPAAGAGGVSASTRGLALIYLLNAVSFAGVLVVLYFMKTSGSVAAAPGTAPEPLVDSLKAGLRFVFRTPIMVWTMTLDFFATFFSGSISLLPIFAEILHAGPVGYGWLRAAPGLGALAGSIWASLRGVPRRQGPVFLWAVAAYGAATVVFGLSRVYSLTFVALALSGLADTISTVVRQTVRQMVTPDAMRGRMTGVNMIFFMGGPQLGEMEAGVVAALFSSVALGATVAVVSGGLATMVVAAVVALAAPIVRKYELGAAGQARSAS